MHTLKSTAAKLGILMCAAGASVIAQAHPDESVWKQAFPMTWENLSPGLLRDVCEKNVYDQETAEKSIQIIQTSILPGVISPEKNLAHCMVVAQVVEKVPTTTPNAQFKTYHLEYKGSLNLATGEAKLVPFIPVRNASLVSINNLTDYRANR